MFQNLLKLANHFEKISAIENITFYHGTDGKHLLDIFKNGLDINKSKSSSKAVYLTFDFGKAARYAAWSGKHAREIPIILEVKISGKQNIKKIQRDDLDHPNIWTNFEEDVSNDGREALRAFKANIKDVFGELPYELSKAYSWEELIGINFYKSIISHFKSKGENVQNIKQKLFKRFPNNYYIDTYAEIAEDGTILAQEDYYEQMHQAKYFKNIPPQAIKFVYIGNFSGNQQFKILEQKNQAPTLLPQEAKRTFEAIRNELSRYNLSKINNKEDLLEFIENLKYEDPFELFSETFENIEKEVKESFADEFNPNILESLFDGLEYYINENWGNDIQTKNIIWTKLLPQDALRYVKNQSNIPLNI